MVNKLWLLGLCITLFYFGPLTLLGWGNAVYPSDNTLNSIIKAAERIVVSSTVNGDVVAFGGSIRSEGRVHNDLLALGDYIISSGPVDGNGRLLGRALYLDGTITKNLTVAGINFTANPGSIVRGNLLAAASTVTLNGKVTSDVTVKADKVILSCEVGKNVEIYANSLTILPRAKFAGKVTYFGPKPAKVYPTAAFTTPLSFHPTPKTTQGWQHIVSIMGVLLLAFLSASFFPRSFATLSDRLLQRPVRNLLRGAVFAGLVPFICTILLWFRISRTTGLALLSAYLGLGLLALLFGQITWGSVVGKLLWRLWGSKFELPEWSANKNSLIQTLLGTLILQFFILIPYLGMFMLAAFMLSTLGGMIAQSSSGARWPQDTTFRQSAGSM
ncbi:MAG: polymer-forming cytoskeletal protein [Peptococcaceae bacterium]|nr:polymer-forming cytoskeletal protein [Peptococcaceae bacterium]